MQRMPLQRAGVLELVDQHMANARVEPLLHPARELVVAQQRQAQRSRSAMSAWPRLRL
jgi:hypothetical protein